MINAGIDLHADNMVIVAINNNGKVVREAILPSRTRVLDDFFNTFDEPIPAVVECPSFWYWLSDRCRENDIPLILAHAKMVKVISYVKVKTDKVDAKTLAELLRARRLMAASLARGRSWLKSATLAGSPQPSSLQVTAGWYRAVKTAAAAIATSPEIKMATTSYCFRTGRRLGLHALQGGQRSFIIRLNAGAAGLWPERSWLKSWPKASGIYSRRTRSIKVLKGSKQK